MAKIYLTPELQRAVDDMIDFVISDVNARGGRISVFEAHDLVGLVLNGHLPQLFLVHHLATAAKEFVDRTCNTQGEVK